VEQWRDLFNIYDVLLYDLTSTYFEADPPFPEGDKRRYGYSRDRQRRGRHPDLPLASCALRTGERLHVRPMGR
jgi:hypothetical protein